MRVAAGNYDDLEAVRRIARDAAKNQAYEEALDPAKRKGFFGSMAGSDQVIDREREVFSAAYAATGNLFDAYTASVDHNSTYYQAVTKRKQAEFIEQEAGMEDPIRKGWRTEATANAVGKLQQMRALGMGAGYQFVDEGGWSGYKYVNKAERFLNKHYKYGSAATMAAFEQMAAIGPRAAAEESTGSVLAASASGVFGAAQMAGILNRQGPGAGAKFVDLVASMRGDVSTNSLLGSFVAQQIGQQNLPGFGGAGLLGMLQAGTQGPAGGAIARQNIEGIDPMASMLSGSRDDRQKAINYSLMRKIAPDDAGASYLAAIDPTRAAQIAASEGEVALTPREKALGLTSAQLKQATPIILNTERSRGITGQFKVGSDAYRLQAEIAKGTDFVTAERLVFGNDVDRADAAYGTILGATGTQGSESALTGTARIRRTLGRPVRSDEFKGEVGRGSTEEAQARAEQEKERIGIEAREEMSAQIQETANKSTEAYKLLIVNSSNIATTAEQIGKILFDFGKSMKSIGGGGAATNTRASPKDK